MTSSAPLGGRYQLAEMLGRGGMAEVYRAEDLKLHRQVAVKLLHDGAGDESDRARFMAEARTLAMLSHSGLVTVFDAGFGDSRPFLVMELVEGPTLGQQIAQGPLLIDDVSRVGLQVAEALAYVHQRGIVHRDVKPGNVLGSGARVKLADFGIARLLEQTTRHTRTGHAIGTAAYLAPEQVQGQEVTGAADVYSLGLVLLEAITGKREYDGPATEAALARLSREPQVPPHLPGPWTQLLTDMLQLDPGARPTAAQVATAIRQSLPAPVPAPTVGVPDADTAPIIATEPPTAVAAAPPTTPLTQPPASLAQPPAGPAAPSSGPTEEWAVRAQRLRRQLAETPTHVRAIVAGLAVLVLLLVVAAVAGGTSSAPEIPENTPEQLRGPLEDLHVAVEGDGE